MPAKFQFKEDLTGKTFNKLTVLGWVTREEMKELGFTKGRGEGAWKALCECGNITYASSYELTSGRMKSCGCSRGAKIIDLTGQVFGLLTVIKRVTRPEGKCKGIYWLCECECGNTIIASTEQLRKGVIISCGCVKKERVKYKREVIHGYSYTRVYVIWKNMMARCYNPKDVGYKNYGARGVTVYDEWHDVSVFAEWAYANGYADDLTIDRINTNGNYEPDNCRWVSMKVQQNNKRNNVFLEYKGERLTLAQWSDKMEIPYSTLVNRHSNGWSIEEILETPVKESKTRYIEYNGEVHNISEWERLLGFRTGVINKRIKMGWDIKDVMEKPISESHQRFKKNSV